MGCWRAVGRGQGRANHCWSAHRNVLHDSRLSMGTRGSEMACEVVPYVDLGGAAKAVWNGVSAGKM